MGIPLIIKDVERKIISFKDKKVILDSDVAELYGIETKRVNEAVKNNPEKFPEQYIIHLSSKDWSEMKSKNSTSLGPGGKVKPPVAFTEKGLYMLATILKSKKAIETTIGIIEAFDKLRALTGTLAEMNQSTDKEKQNQLMHQTGEIISDLMDNQFQISDTETTIELNFAVVKLKHTIKRKSGG